MLFLTFLSMTTTPRFPCTQDTLSLTLLTVPKILWDRHSLHSIHKIGPHCFLILIITKRCKKSVSRYVLFGGGGDERGGHKTGTKAYDS